MWRTIEQVDSREDGTPGFYNNFWLDRGTTAVGSRTSLIVEPADGRLPRLMADAHRRADSAEASRIAATRRGALPAESWTDLDAGDRCIQHAKAGPPISVGGYNNNIRLFQTPGYVALLNEQNHDVRVIPLDGRPHVGAQILQWMGDSRGHWEGETLVVKTTNFNGKHDQIGRPLLSTGENLSLVERFTRTDPETLLYEFTVTDPTIWVSPWTAQLPMKRNPELIYEFACHEGNYGSLQHHGRIPLCGAGSSGGTVRRAASRRAVVGPTRAQTTGPRKNNDPFSGVEAPGWLGADPHRWHRLSHHDVPRSPETSERAVWLRKHKFRNKHGAGGGHFELPASPTIFSAMRAPAKMFSSP